MSSVVGRGGAHRPRSALRRLRARLAPGMSRREVAISTGRRAAIGQSARRAPSRPAGRRSGTLRPWPRRSWSRPGGTPCRSPIPTRCSSASAARPSSTSSSTTGPSRARSWRRCGSARCSSSATRRARAASRSSRSGCRSRRPDWLTTTVVSTPNGTTSDALVAADLGHLLWGVNQGCLGFHVWPNRLPDLEVADELRVDLDPSPGIEFEQLQEGAVLAHELLAGARPRGAHQDVGVAGSAPLRRARAALGQLRGAGGRGGAGPGARATPPRSHHRGVVEGGARAAGVFVDFNQNAPHKTVFGAWCVRPRVGAQVSTPITWDELATVVPDELTIATVPARARRARQRLGGHVRPPAGPHAAARAVGPRPRQRPPGRAVAARVPEDAARAAEGRPEPGPHDLTRGSRSRCAVAHTAGQPQSRGTH